MNPGGERTNGYKPQPPERLAVHAGEDETRWIWVSLCPQTVERRDGEPEAEGHRCSDRRQTQTGGETKS